MGKWRSVKPLHVRRGYCNMFDELINAIEWDKDDRALEIIEEMRLRVPALFDMKDRDGRTPLIWAIACGKAEIAKILIENMSPHALMTVTPSDGETALTWAAESGMLEICRLLLSKIGS